jgi:putative tryptophan/tyrosine transport system substrate-binding protein
MKTGNTGGHRRRRDLIEFCAAAFLASGAAEAWPLDAQAQPANYRFGEGRDDLVVELVQLQPDVVVAHGGPAVSTVKNATTVVPIVMMTGDPVGSGFVVSLPRPGGNITGVSMLQGVEGLTGTRAELLKDALPAATRIGFLFNPESATSAADLAEAEWARSWRGLVIGPSRMRRGDKIEAAVAALSRKGADGAHVQPSFPFFSYPRETGELLLKYRVPAISELRQLADSGGLLSYGPNLFDTARRLAYFVDRILKGAGPADLPVEQASRLELVVNMKTARALGLTIPQSILLRADEVIE